MNIITTEHLERIKKITAGFIIICCLIALLFNIIIRREGAFFNIILLATVSVIFAITLFINSQKKIIYVIQIIIILLGGISTTIFSNTSYFLGDIIILMGILLAFMYGIIKTYSYKIIIPIIAGIAIIKGISRPQEIAVTLMSSSLILFIWILIKTELVQYVREAQKHESLARIGLNAGNFIHNLHLATAMHLIKRITKIHMANEYINKDAHKSVTKYLTNLNNWVDEKVEMRHLIVGAIGCNKTTTVENVDIHKTLQGVITTMYFDERVFQSITTKTDFFPADIYIKAVPFEIYYMLQNIMLNAVESMLKEEDKAHTLTVTTEIIQTKFIIKISDTGPGFPLKNGQVSLESSSPTGGYGTRYVKVLIQNYKGQVFFYNNKEGGATVKLVFPAPSNTILICFKKEDTTA